MVPPHHQRWVITLAGVSFLLLLAILFTSAKIELFTPIQQILLSFMKTPWIALTLLGDTTVTILLLLPFLYHNPKRIQATLWAIILATIISHTLKILVNEDRPASLLAIPIMGEHLYHGGFPSGHTTSIFVWVGLILMNQKRSLGFQISITTLGLLVGLSRIAVGAHWPQDVLGGIICGLICSYIGFKLSLQYPLSFPAWMRYIPYGMILMEQIYVGTNHYHTGFSYAWDQGVRILNLLSLFGTILLLKRITTNTPVQNDK
jgi:membrane-associated phospholipid phosphatase